MENFLRKLKLIDEFSVSLNVDKTEFVNALRSQVDQEDIGSIFSGFFEEFSSSKNLYKGLVDHNGFKIRKRRRFFERKFGHAIANGNYRSFNNNLIIEIKVSSQSKFLLFGLGSALVFYIILLNMMIASGVNDVISFIVPFVLIHAVFMIGIPYFMMRRGVSTAIEDLEREFFFIASKINSK